MSKKTVIVILGMHRSGTSALGGIVHTLGISMGDNLFSPSEDNKKGYYEDKDIVLLNEKILKNISSRWDDIFLLENQWENAQSLGPLYEEAETVLKTKISQNDTIGLKDPRMCLLLPFWEKVFASLNLDVNVLFIFRNPIEVSKSLHKRNTFSEKKALALWLKYNYYALNNSKEYPRVFISYEQLFTELEKKIEECQDLFNLSVLNDYSSKKNNLSSFIDKSLHRNVDRNEIALHKEINTIFEKLISVSNNITEDTPLPIINKQDVEEYIYSSRDLFKETVENEKTVITELNHATDELLRLRSEVHKRTHWALNLKNQLHNANDQLLRLQETLKERDTLILRLKDQHSCSKGKK